MKMEGLMEMQHTIEKFMQSKMPEEVAKKAADIAVSRMIAKGDIILHIGDVPKELYFVTSGLLRSYYIDMNGNDVTRFFMKENSFCGTETLLIQEASKCCIEALEDCKVLAVDGSDIKELIERNRYCAQAYIKVLESSVLYKIERESSFLLKSATERYLDFKKMYPKMEERVNQAYIASYLGITPVSLSRIRKNN